MERYTRKNINHYNFEQLKGLSRNPIGNKLKLDVPEMKSLVEELISLSDKVGSTSAVTGFMRKYPIVWCGIPKISRSELIEQLKEDGCDDEDIKYELVDYDLYLESHVYEKVWLNGSVIRYIGENTNEIVAYVDNVGALIDMKSGIPAIYLEDSISEEIRALKIAEARLALELIVEQYKLLLNGKDRYYSQLDIPWIYRLTKAPIEYLASIDESFESATSKLDESTVEYFLRHKDDFIGDHDGVELTKERYLCFCRTAIKYGLGEFFDDNLSALESYKRYADGRHGGLLDIFDQSPEAFLSWYRGSERQGCHPFEIIAGATLSNAMHLYPSEKEGKFTLTLRFGDQNYRYDKLILAAVALHRAGVMVYVEEADAIIAELLGAAEIGIFPYNKWHQSSFIDWEGSKISTWTSADRLPLNKIDESKLVFAPLSHRF